MGVETVLLGICKCWNRTQWTEMKCRQLPKQPFGETKKKAYFYMDMLQNGLSHRGQSVCADTPQAVSNKFSLSCPKRPPALAKVTGFPLAVHLYWKYAPMLLIQSGMKRSYGRFNKGLSKLLASLRNRAFPLPLTSNRNICFSNKILSGPSAI